MINKNTKKKCTMLKLVLVGSLSQSIIVIRNIQSVENRKINEIVIDLKDSLKH